MMPVEILHTILHPFDNMLIHSPDELAMFPSTPYQDSTPLPTRRKALDEMSRNLRRLFLEPLTIDHMLSMSGQMRRQFRRQLREGQDSMLPSYSKALPTGQEKGTFLALDVGGSTLRLALVDLNGRSQKEALHIRRMIVAPINQAVRMLPSEQFFDWIAQRVETMLLEEPGVEAHGPGSWPIGLAWSFPVDQTSQRSGKIRGMGKGFCCHYDTMGLDLGDLIVNACAARNIHVRIEAIVNDSSATLLSQAYLDPATSMGLIVGTGTNAAVHLPVSALATKKFGTRDESWYIGGSKVITNTELSMFGKGILPETRWDEVLNGTHPMPDFQPLEYMTTGRYLGEILRLIILEAVDTRGLFGGVLPPCLYDSYTLDTILLANLEQDLSPNFKLSSMELQQAWNLPKPPAIYEMEFLRSAAEAISHRASAYLAVAIHALWALQKELEVDTIGSSNLSRSSVACNGSVILKYPGFRDRCEDFIAQMIESEYPSSNLVGAQQVVLQPTDEAAIRGAAVAVALSINEG